MKATKTPGNVVVTLEMSDEEFTQLLSLWTRVEGGLTLLNTFTADRMKFYNTTHKLVKAILYGGQEEIVA